MNMPPAYEGKEPYIFISYAHKNSDQVLPIIRELQRRGFRIWYDAGIKAGTEWPEYIASRLAACDCCLAFISQAALDSQNCRREIHFAISRDLKMLTVYLEQVELSLGLEMQLGPIQALYRDRHTSERSFLDALSQAEVLKPCRLVVDIYENAGPEAVLEKPAFMQMEDPDLGIVAAPEPRKVDLSATELDLRFVEAVELALQRGAVNTSLLQRRMTIGYGRASRILDQLVQCGIAGPNRGPKPREVLIDRAQWEKIKIEWDL